MDEAPNNEQKYSSKVKIFKFGSVKNSGDQIFQSSPPRKKYWSEFGIALNPTTHGQGSESRNLDHLVIIIQLPVRRLAHECFGNKMQYFRNI